MEISESSPEQKIPQELQEVVDRIPSEAPQIFREQAVKAASFIARLEKGEKPEDRGIRKFISQLSQAAFIFNVKADAHTRFTEKTAKDPRKVLPRWLQDDFLSRNRLSGKEPVNLPEERYETDLLYDKWVAARGYQGKQKEHGVYFNLHDDFDPIYRGSEAKIYIEGHVLFENFKNGLVPELLDKLSREKIGPPKMKLNDGFRLVLYFDTEEQIKRFEMEAEECGVDFRGPAQDVWQFVVQADKSCKGSVYKSNDSALGRDVPDSVGQYRLEKYNPADFFAAYLNLCLHTGKNPAEPYASSFYYIIDPEGFAVGEEQELIDAGTEKMGAPVIYARHRLDVQLKAKAGEEKTQPPSQKVEPRGFPRWLTPWKKSG